MQGTVTPTQTHKNVKVNVFFTAFMSSLMLTVLSDRTRDDYKMT